MKEDNSETFFNVEHAYYDTFVGVYECSCVCKKDANNRTWCRYFLFFHSISSFMGGAFEEKEEIITPVSLSLILLPRR